MIWPDYIKFTATTALPAAANPEYLRLGLLEEAHEFLSAYCAMRAAELGLQKRLLRGDDEATIAAKRADIDRHRQKAIEELGDVCWYTARVGVTTTPHSKIGHNLRMIMLNADMLSSGHHDQMAVHADEIVRYAIGLMDVSLQDVLAANVAKLTARKEAGTIQGQGDR